MLTISIDTALKRCSVAIVKDGEPLAIDVEDREKGHAERIAPMADAALKKASAKPGEIDRVGVVIGPGGFTGVRVGLSFARSFGLAVGAPVVGVVSLDALASNNERNGDIAAIVDARRGQVFAALYRDGKRIIEPFVATPEEAVACLSEKAGEQMVVIGDGAEIIDMPAGWIAAEGGTQIDPLTVARLAAEAPSPDAPPAPLYLRGPDAKPSSNPLARK